MTTATRGDAVRIGGSPALHSWKLIVLVTGIGSAVLASFPAGAYLALGVGAWSWVLGLLSVWVLLGGGLLLGLHLAYGGIVWHPDARLATLRGRTVPIDTITEAWRSLSSGNGAAYVVYRFVSTDGPSVRLLVAGRPMKGLDAAGLEKLARFVRELPLVVPDAAAPPGDDDTARLTDRQRASAVSLTTGGGKSRVGRETLLAELGAAVDPSEPGSSDPAAPGREAGSYRAPASGRPPVRASGERATISEREADRLMSEWDADDQHAARLLAAEPGAARRLRRVLFWLLFGSLAFVAVVLVLAVVQEQVGGELLGAGDDDLIGLLIIGPGFLALVFYIAWCAAADADVRHRRQLGRRWLDERARDDRAVRERGLAAPLLIAWTSPVARLRTVIAFLLCMIGFIGLIAGIVLFTDDLVLVGWAAIVGGVAFEVIAVLVFLRVQRRRRADAEQLVVLGGWRLLPPELEA